MTLSTYRFAAGKLAKFIGGVRVGEATPRGSTRRCGPCARPTARRWPGSPRRSCVAALQLAVMAGVLGSNPVRDVQTDQVQAKPKGAIGLTGDQLRELLERLRAIDVLPADHDLVDPITLFIATGLRRSELLGLRCGSTSTRTPGPRRHTARSCGSKGKGLMRLEETKSRPGSGRCRSPLRDRHADGTRRELPSSASKTMIFPSTAGTCVTRTTSASSGARSATGSACRG